MVVPGIDAAPGTQTPEAAVSRPAEEQADALPGTGAAGLQHAEGGAAADVGADAGTDSLSSLPPELQRPPDTPQNPELEVRSGHACTG